MLLTHAVPPIETPTVHSFHTLHSIVVRALDTEE
jgi:hypothetical protein